LAIVGLGLARGLDYYTTPYHERPFASGYQDLRPAGTLGLRFGAVGTLAVTVGVAFYSVRKRTRLLSRAGKLKYWLEAHIFLCSIGPALVLLHTSFHVGGLVAIAFWSMAIVAVSGAFGRYVYVRLPRTPQGQLTGLEAVERDRADLLNALRDLGPGAAAVERVLARSSRSRITGFGSALWAAVRFNARRRRTVREVKRALATLRLAPHARARAVGVVERHLQIEHQSAIYLPFQRLFRYWHLLHLPLAITMFVIVGIHVTVATLFGYGFGF
jgi:hypothetical protein